MGYLFRVVVLILLAVLFPVQQSHSFSFSEYEKEQSGVTRKLSPNSLSELACPASLKEKKIATMIGERHRDDRLGRDRVYTIWKSEDGKNRDYGFGTESSVYGSLIDGLNRAFKQLGLKTYTAGEIHDQIVREEEEAFLNNNLDAALSAAERLSADFMLKGVISTLTQTNKVVKVDELFVTISLSLLDKSGNQLSSTKVSVTTFTDADVGATVQKLVQDQSQTITYQLFADYCKGGT